jgi:hypothetical protein
MCGKSPVVVALSEECHPPHSSLALPGASASCYSKAIF